MFHYSPRPAQGGGHVAGQLDDLVAGFSRTNSKLSDLRNSVRTVCNRWGSEQLSQQQQLWKLQQATVDLQRTVVSKACRNSPSYSKSSPLPFISNGTPTRNVFAEVQLNRQNTPVQEHDPKVRFVSMLAKGTVLAVYAVRAMALFGR